MILHAHHSRFFQSADALTAEASDLNIRPGVLTALHKIHVMRADGTLLETYTGPRPVYYGTGEDRELGAVEFRCGSKLMVIYND